MKRKTKKLLCFNLSLLLLLSTFTMPAFALEDVDDVVLCEMESAATDGTVDLSKPDRLAASEDASGDASETDGSPVLLAEAVLSSADGYGISVDGIRFTSDQAASGSGWTYSPDDHSLTLNSYNGGTISASGDLVIYTHGNCNITGSSQSYAGLGSGTYGSSAIAVSGELGGVGANLDIFVEDGTLSVTAGSGSVSGGDAVSVSGIIYCHCDGTASFTGGAITGSQNRGGDALYARNAVILRGRNITSIGGSASTSSTYQLSGGCAIYSSRVSVYADCTLKGGTGYIGGPAVYFANYCQFGLANVSASSGGAGTGAIVSDPAGLTWYYHPHTTITGNNASFEIAVNRYTLFLNGNGGRTWSGATFTSLREYYPAKYYLDGFSFKRNGYTQVAWGRVAGELQSAPTVQETWTDADGASHTTVWETWTESELIPYDAYYQPTEDTTLYAKWVSTGANDILLNGLFGRFSDGTAFRKTTGTAVKLPKTLSYAYGGNKNVLAWTDTSAVSSNDLHIYKESAFYSGGDVIAPDASAATVLYAWENDGLFARYHATLGQLRQGGSILLQGEGANVIASATSLTTYVPDDSLLIAPENYEFSGWSLRENSGTADYLPGERITLSRNVTDLYAVWTPTQLTRELTDGVTLTQSFKDGRITVSATAEWCGSSGAQSLICALYDSTGRMLRSSVADATAQGITALLPYQAGSYATCKLFPLDGSYRPIGEPLTCVPENLWHDSTGTLMAGKTVILHSNDVHGNVEGYAYIAALKADYEAKGAEVILVDAGDFSQGTTYVSTTKGADAVAMMNAVGYDVVTLGNHEFDYGYAQLKENMKKAEFKVVCADVYENGKTIFDSNFVYTTASGVKVGFFGLETPEAQTKANPAKIKGLTFLDGKPLFKCAQDQIDALKKTADVVICLSHLGVDGESTGHRSYDLWNNTAGIDMIIDGHSHTVMVEGANGEPIQSTGTAFENVGVIVIDDLTKVIESNKLVAITEESVKDEAVAAAAKVIVDRVDAEYNRVFARSAVTLNGAKSGLGNRDSETNNGDLLTDAMLWTVLKDAGSVTVPDDHVVAVTNGGGIRAAIHPGNVTKKDINTVLPFGNTVTVVYVTGAELLEALEASTYCTPTAVGGFPQVAGIDMTIDTTKAYDANAETYPASTYYGPKTIQRVTINSVNGKAFSLTDTYAVVTNDFCAAGGDTYYAFAAATAQFDTGIPLDEAVMDYITNELNGVIGAQYAEPQGRITVLLPDRPAATRVWLVEQLCEFLNIDTSAYDPATLTFTDCADLTDAQKRAVLAAVYKGIAAGRSSGEFDPYGEVTREQGAMLLYRAAGSPAVGSVTLPYSDVENTRWSADAVRYLYGIGVLKSADSFDPTGTLQQQEFAACLDRMKEYYTPGNLHFEIRNGVGYLDWDGPEENGLLYNIEARDGLNDPWYRLTRQRQSETTVHEYGDTCFGFRVAAVLNGYEVAAVADSALKSVANRDSTVQEVTSATFMRTNTDPLTYRADVSGVAGYPLVLLRVDAADDGNAWRSTTGGSNEVSITVYDDDNIVADGEYRVLGYNNYALSDDGKTLTYDTCTLNSPKPCAPNIPTSAHSVSNLRFISDQETGLPALAWDFDGAAADEVRFRVIGNRADGSQYNGIGTDRPRVLLTFDAGSYTRFEVQMRSRADNRLLASATADLTLTVTQDTDDLRADMIFYDLGNDEYLVSITGMNGYNNYHAYMRDTQNSGDGFYGWVDGSGASARIYFDGNRLLANRSCEVYGLTDYVLTSSTQASYHTALVYSSATPNIQPYTITNIRFETIGGLPQLAWDAPVVAGTRFRVFTNRTGNGGYKYDVGGTGNYLSMPVTIQESGEYEGMLVQAYYRDIPLKFACDDLLCVSVNSASAAASAAVDITKENNGRYRVDASGFTGYDVYSIKFALDPNGPDWRIGRFGETEGENTVTAYFNDDGTYCENGYYRICATKNYALSGDNKTLSFDLAVLNEWTPCGGASGDYSVSNLRFEMEDGVGYLAWDFDGAKLDDVNFNIITTDSEGRTRGGANVAGMTRWLLCRDAGTYTKFRVEMVRMSDGAVLASTERNMTLTVTEGTASNSASSIFYHLIYAPDASTFIIKTTGLDGMAACHITIDHPTNGGEGFMREVHDGESVYLFRDRHDLVPSGSYRICGMSGYTLSSPSEMSYTKSVLLDTSPAIMYTFGIENARFEQCGDAVVLTWDVPVLVDGLSFQITTNRDSEVGYATELGRTNENCFYLTETEKADYHGIQIWTMLGERLIGGTENLDLNIVVDAPTSAAEDFYMEWKETADAGVFRALTSRVPDTYPVLRVALCDDPDDIDEYRTQSCLAGDGGTASLYFRDNDGLCTQGFYSLWGGRGYTLSDGDNTLHYHMTLLRDWTPCSTETPHDHVWTTATEQSWLIPAQSACSRCGLLRVDEACLRDEALQTLTYTEEKSVQQNASGKSFYATVGTFKNAQQETVYTELRTNTFDTDDWEELFAWNGEMGTPQERMFDAYGYDNESDGVTYRRMAVNTYDQNHHKTRVDYYRVNADGIYVPDGWDVDFVYDVNGNLLSYKFYEAHGHNAWNYENTYYPNGVRATYRMLDPDNGNACVRERCFTAEGELWKFSYNFNGTVEVTYYGGYSEQNPYLYDGN